MKSKPIIQKLFNVSGSPSTKVSRTISTGHHYLLKKRLTNQEVSPVPKAWLRNILSDIDNEVVFIHVGLSAVNAAFDGNPYTFLRSMLHDEFGTILAPGFTDYFRETGVYSNKYSRPNTGAFARLLLGDADYRTDDAVKSIIVDGPYDFEGCDCSHSYSDYSPFAQLKWDNVPIVNIGTPWLKSSQIHYLEYQYGVPHVKTREFKGVRITENTTEHIVQQTTRPTELSVWNRRKIRKTLEAKGSLQSYEKNGLRVLVTRANDLERVVGPKLESDPYWLVT